MNLLYIHQVVKYESASPDTSAIHLASEQGHDDIVRLLIAKNAEVDVKSEGDSPLTLAIFNNHSTVADILLQHGANIQIKMPKGEDLLNY